MKFNDEVGKSHIAQQSILSDGFHFPLVSPSGLGRVGPV